MFLVILKVIIMYFLLYYNCMSYVFGFFENCFNFIENHSVFVGIITAVVTSSLWLRKYINQKRAEAFFDFYSQLLLKIKYLKSQLVEASQLDHSEGDHGNIYSLLYTNGTMLSICEGYNKPVPAKIRIFSEAAENLRQCILDSKCNVYPKKANRKKWYDSQHIVLSFCEFIIEVNAGENDDNDKNNNGLHNIYNTSREDNDKIPIHRVKCKELVEAMDYIISSIENERY